MAWRDRLPAIAFALKLVITIGLFAYLLRKVEIASVVMQLAAMSPVAAAGAEALLLVQLLLLALRWQVVNRIVDAPMQAGQVLRLMAIGNFFNQVLPSGFAGDAARAWLVAREGVRLGPACPRAIVCDRVIGLLVLIVMVSVTLLALPGITGDKVPGRRSFGLIALLGVGASAALFLIGAPVARLLSRHPADPFTWHTYRRSPLRALSLAQQERGSRHRGGGGPASQRGRRVLVRERAAYRSRLRRGLGHRSGSHAGLDGADLVRRVGCPGGGDDRWARPHGDRGR